MAISLWQRSAPTGQDRRTDERVPCIGATLVDVLDPHPQAAVPARILDAGSSSMKLALPIFVAPGTLLRITVGMRRRMPKSDIARAKARSTSLACDWMRSRENPNNGGMRLAFVARAQCKESTQW